MRGSGATLAHDEAPPKASVRPWSVMHATDDVRAVLELAEAQRQAGMRPVLVTPAGYGSIELYLRQPMAAQGSVSLLSMWQDVRQWRKSLGECAEAAAMEILHAHCFAAGMSGVRNWPVVVYDLAHFVEHDAEASQQWLARSLRVAEQFVLARAEAVVVHRRSLCEKAKEHGAEQEHLFVVPEPLAAEEGRNDRAWRPALEIAGESVTLVATDLAVEQLDALLSAFAQTVSEVEQTVLLLRESDPAAVLLHAKLTAAGVGRAVRTVADDRWREAIHNADVVLLGDSGEGGPNPSGLEAMRAGGAVLAADLPCNRDLSPEGRGCLWYQYGNARDLAARASFLARNADFRRSLGAAARNFLEETRSPEAVARAYDAVYRHAFARRGDDSAQRRGRLEPLPAAF